MNSNLIKLNQTRLNQTDPKTEPKTDPKNKMKNLTINLSKFQPEESHLSLLEKGLTFIPSPKNIAVKTLLENSKKIARSLTLKYFFRKSDKPFDPKIKTFKEKSKWTPKTEGFPRDIRNSITEIHKKTWDLIRERKPILINGAENIPLKINQNLTYKEKTAIRELKSRDDIVIKSADKGGATVILDKEAYRKEALRQLQNKKYYLKLKEPIYTQNIPKIRAICNRMRIKGFIDSKQFKYLTGPEICRNRIFYLLPKIHKDKAKWPQENMPEGRPIVSDVNSESYRVSEFIDYHINKLACLHPSYLKNTYDFIENIRNKKTSEDNLIVTGDVTSLYTNMNINRTVACVKRALAESKANHQSRPDQEIVELLDLTLKNNDFEFDGEYYLQTCGTAMGKKYAPALANLYLLDFDRAAMEGLPTDRGVIKPYLYKRYLDDIFFIWPGTPAELKLFEQHLDKVTAGIRITLEFDKSEMNFLDTTVYKENDTEENTGSDTTQNTQIIKTRVFFKPTDTHQLLHTSSFHPTHTTKGILKSQLIRFKRISSSKKDYDNTCKILFKTLQNRGYTRTNLRKQQKHVWYNHTEKAQVEKETKPQKILPITVNFDEMGKTLAKKYKDILQTSEFFKEYKIITAFTNHKNLRQQLVRSRL